MRTIVQEIIPGVDRDVSLVEKNERIIAYTMQTPVKTKKLLYTRSVKFFDDSHFLKIIQKIRSKLKWSRIVHLDF